MDQKILIVLPHPDDESFSIAGSIAESVQAGAHVTYACLTLGEMGRNMGVPIIASRVTLPSIRKLELEASCRAIGIQDIRMLGFHDKMIEFEDQELLDGTIHDLVQELQPSLVITFYPGYSVHPDHDATGAAVVRTIGRLPAEQRPTVHCIAFSKDVEQALGQPDIIHDVTDFVKNKVASIQAHKSQFQVPELSGKNKMNDRELAARFGTERLWTYRFE